MLLKDCCILWFVWSFLQCFDTVVWVSGRAILIPKNILWNRWQKKMNGNRVTHVHLKKMAVTTEEAVGGKLLRV